jgi:uncharacterized membrane protein YhaH (DUF805 family)
MSFGEAIKSYFKNYAVFKGRSRRSAFWFTVLFTGLVSIALGIINPADADENGFKNPSHSGSLFGRFGASTTRHRQIRCKRFLDFLASYRLDHFASCFC